MNIPVKKSASVLLTLTVLFSFSAPVQASPWAKKEGYWPKTGGKFVFGLKHSLFSWTSWWTESKEPKYNKEWEGFNVGIGKTVVYTAAGLIQLATFFIPVDFPNIGIGIHIPSKECPERHDENYVPGQGAKPVVPPAPAPLAAEIPETAASAVSEPSAEPQA